MSGALIVFEGIDGCGKTTQVFRAVTYLQGLLGADAVERSKDLGGSALGEALRKIMYEVCPPRDAAPGVVDLLFLAGHLQNWHELVKPWLAQDKIVISDRWWLSQFAYTVARDYDPDVQKLYEVKHGAWPDLTIFLHGDSRTLLERANARPDVETHQRRKSWNDADKQRRVRDRYFELYSGRPGWTPISVDFKDEEKVWQEVRRAIDGLLQERITNA